MEDRKVALVTGGARGIGMGISEQLARDGFNLAVCGTRPEADAAEPLTTLRAIGGQVLYSQCDISKADDRGRMLDEVRAAFGRLDILVNNAGVAPSERKDMLDASEESFERLLRINLQGPYFLTQAAARWMIDRKKADNLLAPAIVFISSVSATMASINRGEYCVSKAGVAMAASLWAARLAPLGVNVYEVRPGVIMTDMTAGVKEKYDALIAEGLVPQMRWGAPSDIAQTVAAICRGDMPYSTGAVITVDGGLSISRL